MNKFKISMYVNISGETASGALIDELERLKKLSGLKIRFGKVKSIKKVK